MDLCDDGRPVAYCWRRPSTVTQRRYPIRLCFKSWKVPFIRQPLLRIMDRDQRPEPGRRGHPAETAKFSPNLSRSQGAPSDWSPASRVREIVQGHSLWIDLISSTCTKFRGMQPYSFAQRKIREKWPSDGFSTSLRRRRRAALGEILEIFIQHLQDVYFRGLASGV